jgi:uncharacterized membrane protein YraQ (UPF0718 family)
MKKYYQKIRPYLWVIVFAIFILASYSFQFQSGKTIATNFKNSIIEMITFIPFLFIIVGLFDVWVPKDKIEKHIGQESGLKGIMLVTLLAMLQAGPLYGAFPVAYMLFKKGASIRNIFVYLGAFASLKIPMLGIEIGYLGIKFTLVRTLVSLPLFIGIGYIMEWYLKDKNFEVKTP